MHAELERGYLSVFMNSELTLGLPVSVAVYTFAFLLPLISTLSPEPLSMGLKLAAMS